MGKFIIIILKNEGLRRNFKLLKGVNVKTNLFNSKMREVKVKPKFFWEFGSRSDSGRVLAFGRQWLPSKWRRFRGSWPCSTTHAPTLLLSPFSSPASSAMPSSSGSSLST